MPNRQPYTLDRVVRLLITLSVILIAIWLINLLKGVLLPFLVAWLIAYLMEPLVQYNRRMLKLKGRAPAIFMTLFEVSFLICAAAYFLMPMMLDELHQAVKSSGRMRHQSAMCRFYLNSSTKSLDATLTSTVCQTGLPSKSGVPLSRV